MKAPSQVVPRLRAWVLSQPARTRAWARALTPQDLGRLARAALLLAGTWALFWALARHLTYYWPSLDEKHFIWEGWSLQRGLVPYRDFTDFKPPVLFVINEIALRLLSLENLRYRYVFTFLAGASITSVVVTLMARRVNKLLIFALVLIIHLLWIDPHYHDSSFDDAESIGMSFYLMGIAALLIESRAKRLTDFLGGALLALAVLCKEPYALMAVPTWASVLLMSLAEENAARTTKRYVQFTLAGVAAVIFWLLSYLIAKGSLCAYVVAFKQYLPFAKRICIEYGVWKPAGFWNDWSVRFSRLSDSLVNFERLAVAVPLLLPTLVFARRRRWPAVLATWLVAAGGLYAVTLGGCFFEHYFMLGMAGLFFVMVIGLLDLTGALQNLGRRWQAFIGLSLVLLPAWQLFPRVRAELKVVYEGSTPPLESAEVVRFVKEHSAPSDTVFSTGWPGIYVDSERRNAVKESTFFDAFLSLYTGRTDEERLAPVYAELVKSRPKVIYIEPFLAEKRVRTVNALVLPYVRAYGYKKIDDHLYLRPD